MYVQCTSQLLYVYILLGGGGGTYKRLTGMCRWMGSHFDDWNDYNGVAFSTELLVRMGSHIFRFFR